MRLLGVAPLGRREPCVVELHELRLDADVGEQHRSARRLGRVRGQHELDRRAARALGELVVRDRCELPEGVLERFSRDAAVARVLAAPSEPMVLLGEVRELEVEPERPEHERLRLGLEVAQQLRARDASVAAGLSGRVPDPLDQLEQPRALLLDEHVSEDRPEQPNVAAEWRGGVAHLETRGECTWMSSFNLCSIGASGRR